MEDEEFEFCNVGWERPFVESASPLARNTKCLNCLIDPYGYLLCLSHDGLSISQNSDIVKKAFDEAEEEEEEESEEEDEEEGLDPLITFLKFEESKTSWHIESFNDTVVAICFEKSIVFRSLKSLLHISTHKPLPLALKFPKTLEYDQVLLDFTFIPNESAPSFCVIQEFSATEEVWYDFEKVKIPLPPDLGFATLCASFKSGQNVSHYCIATSNKGLMFKTIDVSEGQPLIELVAAYTLNHEITSLTWNATDENSVLVIGFDGNSVLIWDNPLASLSYSGHPEELPWEDKGEEFLFIEDCCSNLDPIENEKYDFVEKYSQRFYSNYVIPLKLLMISSNKSDTFLTFIKDREYRELEEVEMSLSRYNFTKSVSTGFNISYTDTNEVMLEDEEEQMESYGSLPLLICSNQHGVVEYFHISNIEFMGEGCDAVHEPKDIATLPEYQIPEDLFPEVDVAVDVTEEKTDTESLSDPETEENQEPEIKEEPVPEPTEPEIDFFELPLIASDLSILISDAKNESKELHELIHEEISSHRVDPFLSTLKLKARLENQFGSLALLRSEFKPRPANTSKLTNRLLTLSSAQSELSPPQAYREPAFVFTPQKQTIPFNPLFTPRQHPMSTIKKREIESTFKK